MASPATLARLRLLPVLGLLVLPSGCLTPMMWESVLDPRGEVISTETMPLTAFGPGAGDRLVVQARSRGGQLREFHLVADAAADRARLLTLARSGTARECSIRLHVVTGDSALGEGSFVLGGSLDSPVRRLRAQDRKPGAVRVGLPPGLHVRAVVWWKWLTGGIDDPPGLRPIAWLRDGEPIELAEVTAMFATGAADLRQLQRVELYLGAFAGAAQAPSAGIAVRADALWFDHFGRVVRRGERFAWSYTVRVVAGLAPRVAMLQQKIALPGDVLVSVVWHHRRSRVWPIIGATLATPFIFAIDVVGIGSLLTLMLWAELEDDDDPAVSR